MARLMCVADGDNTSAATWAVINSTSYTESETAAIAAPTTYATNYTTFTPGAVTVDGIALRLNNRVGTTGTFSTEIYNTTGSASVAGTEVTINCSDFVDGTGGTVIDGGWYFFKFSSSVTLAAATAYIVRFKTSSASQINIFGSASTAPAKFLRTTTTQAPVAGDDRFIMGEWTAAGSTSTRTVTLNDTSTVDYGSASTSQVTPALSISAGGIVLGGTTASTTYIQKISGTVVVYNGGILRIGTSGSRMPTTSSFTWTFDCAANVDFGITIRRKGEFTTYGASKQRWTLLTSDEAAAATSIQLVSTSGCVNAETLCFAPTGTTTTQGETKIISTVDSSTQVTLTAGLTNAHTGTGDVVGEVGNLTTNVSIIGISTTVGLYITFKDGALGVLNNTGVRYFGSFTSNKGGIESQHADSTVNSFTMESCALLDCTGGAGTLFGPSSFYLTNNVLYTTVSSNQAFYVALLSTTSSVYNVDNNLIISTTGTGSTGFTIGGATGSGATISNNRVAGFATALGILGAPVTISTPCNISGFRVHSNGSYSSSMASFFEKTITDCNFVSSSYGVGVLGGNTTFINCSFIGNSNGGVLFNNTGVPAGVITFNNCTFRGRSTSAQAHGLVHNGTNQFPTKTIFNGCSFGETVAHTTGDVTIGALFDGPSFVFNNCTLASTTEVNSTITSNMGQYSFLGFQRLDTTAGNHKTFVRQGVITPDTVIFKTATPGLRITPKSATIPCSTNLFTFKVPINSGQTCTPLVYVQEDAAYNGNRAKLYVKANYNLGITSDTLLDTATSASDLAWEGLTGTTATTTDAGVLEFYITCDGTAGFLTVDDFTYTNA